MTYEGSRNITSSRGSADGPSQLDLLDGLTIARSGPVPAPASPTRRQAKVSEPMIQGICGRTYIGSGVPTGPLSEWESRLRERLGTVGSTESALIWREKVSPAGQSISRLSPSTRHTNGTDSTGSPWPTPKASAAGPDFAKMDRSSTGLSLQTVMAAVPAAEVVESDHSSPAECPPSAATVASPWSTARASDGEKGSPNQCFSGGGQPLPSQMAQTALWVTASARDWKDSPGMATVAADGRNRLDQLPRQMAAVAMAHGGQAPTGSSVTMGRRAGSPTPEHPCWLMGFPIEFLHGAASVTRSSRRSQRKS
jgi:hypothetical protein